MGRRPRVGRTTVIPATRDDAEDHSPDAALARHCEEPLRRSNPHRAVISPSPRVRGEGRDEGDLSVPLRLAGTPPHPVCFALLDPTSPRMRGEVSAENRSRGACFSARGIVTTTTRFLKRLPQTKEEAERREAHCPVNVRASQTSIRSLRNSSASAARYPHGGRNAAFRRSRSRHSPPAITPMAQLQNRVSRGVGWQVFCLLRSCDAAVKHAPCRPVLVPVDRGPESRPSAMLRHRPRGPQLAPQFRFASGMRPQHSEMARLSSSQRQSQRLCICAVGSGVLARRAFSGIPTHRA